MDWDGLAKKSKEGDSYAYKTLLKSLTPKIDAYLNRNFSFQSDREDMVQEVLISIHRSMKAYDTGQPFIPWVMTIAKRRMIDKLRSKEWKNGVMTELLEKDPSHSSPNPEVAHESRTQARALHEAVNQLDPKYKEVFQLILKDDKTYKEIAEQLKVSESAVKSRVSRGMKPLQKKMEAFLIDS